MEKRLLVLRGGQSKFLASPVLPIRVLLFVLLNRFVLIAVDLAVAVLVDEGEDLLDRRFIAVPFLLGIPRGL